MTFSLINIYIPHTWIFFAAVFFGAALAQAAVIPGRTKNPEAVRVRKWALCWIFLSISLVFGLCAVFFPGAKHILDISLLKYFGIASGVFFLAFRFKKIAGIPIFLIGIMGAVLLIMALKPWREASGENPIAEFALLSNRDNVYRIEARASGRSAVLEAGEEELSAYCHTLTLHPYYIFGGGKTLYRFGEFEPEAPWTDESSASPLVKTMISQGDRLPGIRVEIARSAVPLPEILKTYDVFLFTNGTGTAELLVKPGLISHGLTGESR